MVTPRAFSRADTALNEATKAASFQDMLVNVASLEGSTTVVVPTASHRRAALVTLARAGVANLPEVVTIATYARQRVQLRGIGNDGSQALRLLSTADAALVLRQAARSTGQRPGSIDFTIGRLLRWKSEGLSPAQLEEKAHDEFAPRFVRVLDRFARIWHAYELIKGPKRADRVDVIAYAASDILQSLTSNQQSSDNDVTQRMVIWQPHTFTHTEAALVRAVGVQMSVAIIWAASSDEVMVRERTSDVIAWDWDQVDSDGGASDESSSDVAQADKFPHAIRVFRENTRIDEVRRILLTIKSSVASGDVGVRDICIITPGSKEYARQLTDRALPAGIPVSIDPQRSLHTTGVALTVRAACDVVSGGWKRADIERLLRSGFVTTDAVDLGALLRVASTQRMLGGEGADQWTEHLRQRRNVIRRILEQDSDNSQLRQTLSEIDAAIETLGWLRPILASTDAPMSGANGFIPLIATFLQKLGIARAAVEFERIAHNANLPCVEREALIALESLSERYAVLTQEIRLPFMTVSEHTREWWEIVRSTLIRVPDARIDGIPILTPEQARGRAWHLVLAPGLVEGELPVRENDPVENELLPDAAARKQRAAFEDIMHAVRSGGTLVLTYPKEVDDAEAMPSVYIQFAQPPFDAAQTQQPFDQQSSASARYILDRHELASVDGKGLPDVRGRQRAALPVEDDVAMKYVRDVVMEPLSAGRLDMVAACPYQFYANRILRLSSVRESQDELSGLERGSMMHDIARKFYEQVRGRSLSSISTLEDVLDARVHLESTSRHSYMSVLLDVFNSVLPQYDTIHTYAETERRSFVGTQERPGLLQRWLALEIQAQADTALRPALFEYEVDVEVNGEAVRGRVDRVDVAPCQTASGLPGIEFAVVDYKTTRKSVPSLRRVRDGGALQMPLYVAAVRASFEQKGIEAIPSAAIYRTFGRSLRSSTEPADRIVLKDPSAEEMHVLFNVITKQVSNMRAHAYPVAPQPRACERCSYAEVCRVASWGTVQNT